jgi:hypothetical protein
VAQIMIIHDISEEAQIAHLEKDRPGIAAGPQAA